MKTVGRGILGKVILAREKETNELLAIKCMKKEDIIRTKNITHIKNEKKILESTNSPFIIKLKHSFQDKEKVYFVLDFYNGGELFSHVAENRGLKEHIAKFFAAEIYLTLEYLHSKNIVYRDLKPENIILTETGHIKLLDFGLSKIGDTKSSLFSTVCGTYQYTPPELICGQKYSFNMDWWCFGIIIYEMINGGAPFYDASNAGLLKKIVHSEPNYNTGKMSESCVDLLKLLLNKDPSKRIKSEDITKHPWFKELDFDAIRELKINSPFKPNVTSKDDLSKIDPIFLSENVASPKRECKKALFDNQDGKDLFEDI